MFRRERIKRELIKGTVRVISSYTVPLMSDTILTIYAWDWVEIYPRYFLQIRDGSRILENINLLYTRLPTNDEPVKTT